MTDLERAERSIKMRGAAAYQNISVKIVPNGDGFGVETTVDGDRRYPVEEPMPLPEAQKLAMAQLIEPRAQYQYTPETKPVSKTQSQSTSRYKPLGDLLHEYKHQGLDKYSAWDQYIKDTILSNRYQTETVDAKEFYKYYARIS